MAVEVGPVQHGEIDWVGWWSGWPVGMVAVCLAWCHLRRHHQLSSGYLTRLLITALWVPARTTAVGSVFLAGHLAITTVGDRPSAQLFAALVLYFPVWAIVSLLALPWCLVGFVPAFLLCDDDHALWRRPLVTLAAGGLMGLGLSLLGRTAIFVPPDNLLWFSLSGGVVLFGLGRQARLGLAGRSRVSFGQDSLPMDRCAPE